MANRYPLILDTADGNKIKELPDRDNLNLNGNNIVNVQNITSIGVIEAAEIKVAGANVRADNFLQLSDTPSTYIADALLKVNSTGTAVEFSTSTNLGNIQVGQITMANDLVPTANISGRIGREDLLFSEIHALEMRAVSFIGDIRGQDGSLIFDSSENQLTYSVITGAPTSLSEFTNDLNLINQSQARTSISVTQDTPNGRGNLSYNNTSGVLTYTPPSEFVGSLYANDSSLIVNGATGEVSYTVSTPGDWASPPPTTVGEALDRLAAVVKATLGAGA